MSRKSEPDGLPSTSERTRVNFKIRKDLRDWAFQYAEETGVSVTQMVEQYFAGLKEKVEREKRAARDEDVVEQI